MDTARVTTKGQITIPQKIREQLGIHTGDVLAFVGTGDETFVVQKIPLPEVRDVQERLSGIAAAGGITEEDVVRWVKEVRAERFAEHFTSPPAPPR